MFLLQKTLETYEKNSHLVGKVEKSVSNNVEYIKTLLPISHRVRKTQLEVTLNESGELLNITCSEKSIIIPTTIQSSGRTSGMAPHVLHDDLKNIAFDAWKLTHPGEKKPPITYKTKEKKGEIIKELIDPLEKSTIAHRSYLTFMEEWLAYAPHWQVHAIYEYMKDNTIIEDLVAYGIFEKSANFKYFPTENEAITNGVKLGNTAKDILKNAIRFHVVKKEDASSIIPIWEDIELMNAYVDFYVNYYLPESDVTTTTSLLTGRQQILSPSVMKFIRDSGDGGKLISINSNYFDTGFFKRNKQSQTAGEVASVGFVESEKAFAALKWLLDKQGIHFSKTHKLLVWGNAEETRAFNPLSNLKSTTEEDEELAGLLNNTMAVSQELDNTQKQEDSFTYEGYMGLLKKALYSFGKSEELAHVNREMFILRIDSFSPGRFYIREFTTMTEQQYVSNILKWHERGMWKHSYYKDEVRKEYLGVPSVMEIISPIVSQEKDRNKNMEITKYSADLLACILNDTAIPLTIIRNLERRLANHELLKVENKMKWYDLQNLVCSLLKNDYGRKGEHYTMVLQKEIKNRDYLFGRWLAVAHLLEETTMKITDKKVRETNAMRYFATYIQRPYTTLNEIAKRIQPYKEKLKQNNAGLAAYYEKLLDEILDLFEFNDFDDRPISGRVHLGFSNQRTAMYQKKSVNEQTEEIDPTEV